MSCVRVHAASWPIGPRSLLVLHCFVLGAFDSTVVVSASTFATAAATATAATSCTQPCWSVAMAVAG